jgi:thiamine kinase-like enzyme
VLIDFEVAHWGNPVFDLAYCLGHLILKAWHLQKEHEVLKLIEVFLCTYELKVENLTPHVGLMLLARMDGKSPVNYIKDEVLKNKIRSIAISWIMEEAAHEVPLQNIQQALIDENHR